MNEIDIILSKIEKQWMVTASDAIWSEVSEEGSAIYGASFWLLYVDYTIFGVPCFAINSENHQSSMDKYSRWAPPEWKIDVHDGCVDIMQPLYNELSEALEGKSEDEWDDIIEKHYNILFRICKKITDEYHNPGNKDRLSSNPEFILAIFEEREGEEMYSWLLKNSIDNSHLHRPQGLPE